MTAPVVGASRRVLSLTALLALFFGVPAGLWVLGGAYLPDEVPTWSEATAALSGPDTGALFAGFLVLVGWAAWSIFALSVCLEIPAQLRGLPAPRLPGLGSAQRLAGLLVAAVIGVGSSALLPIAPAHAGPPTAAEQGALAQDEQTQPADAEDSAELTPRPASAGPLYTVQPRDTLGRIAARNLGDWERFDEIYELNRGRPQPDGRQLTDARLIRPGWVLVLPADAAPQAAPATSQVVVVEPGDTLSEIAEEQSLPGWRPIFDLNAGEQQPGGRRFTDPDLIFPGQVLDIPTPPAPPRPDDDAPPQPDAQAPAEPAPPSADSTPTVASETDPQTGDVNERNTDPGEESLTGLAATLTGGGALLAAGIGAVLLSLRRQRLRSRRTGRMLAATPPTLVPAEAAVLASAPAGAADFTALDMALRSLAVALSDAPGGQLPDVIAARLTEDSLNLRLHAPSVAPPPLPWVTDDTGWWWSLDLAADNPVDPKRARGRLAPYPALVSVGSEGRQRWLLDLERIGLLRLAGPPARCEDFTRHLGAELAINGWSDLLYVTTVGFGAELVDLNAQRLTHDEEVGSAAGSLLATLRNIDDGPDAEQVGVLDARLHASAGHAWMPEILLVAPSAGEGSGDLGALIAAVNERGDRSAVAVVLGDESGDPTGGWLLTLTDDGRLMIPELDLTLQARQLTAQEAADIAALLAFEREAGDAAIPAAAGDQPWEAYTDASGALLADVTAPHDSSSDPDRDMEDYDRSQTPEEAKAPWTRGLRDSVLPRATNAYVRDSAAAAEDVDGPASRVSRGLRKRVEEDLDRLDRDLADWWDPNCTRPRLTLLGPIALRAHGDERAVIRSGLRRRYEEVVAYLATREHGATVDEAAAALRPDRDGSTDAVSARAYVHRVTAGARAWLGNDPTTGEKHLSSGHRGPYALRNVLVDADLFRQLRARSGVRGRDGMGDLLAALDLVSGPPFGQRPSGYDWLHGLDLTYTAAICDVAHLVVTSALSEGDLEAARAASNAALRVAPDDENVLLDAMWVAFRDGNRAEAESLVARIVAVNDGDDEMDLHLRTAETIARARRDFLSDAS